MATRNGVGTRLFWDIIHPGCQNFPTGLHALRGSVLVVAALTFTGVRLLAFLAVARLGLSCGGTALGILKPSGFRGRPEWACALVPFPPPR